jgi:hypothetical protein
MMKRLFPFFLFFLLMPLAWGFQVSATDVMGGGFFDENTPTYFAFSGCDLGSDGLFYLGTHHLCDAPGDSISFEIYGTEFALWAQRQADGGDSNLCIDGDCQVISSYSAVTVLGEWVRITSLELGFHTVTITNVSGSLYFDAVLVAHADAIGTPPPSIHVIQVDLIVPVEVTIEAPEVTVEVELTLQAELTPEPDSVFWEISPEGTEEPQIVSFQYSATAGDVFLGMGIYALAGILLVSLLVQLWKK